jgi:hypothetical protein
MTREDADEDGIVGINRQPTSRDVSGAPFVKHRLNDSVGGYLMVVTYRG